MLLVCFLLSVNDLEGEHGTERGTGGQAGSGSGAVVPGRARHVSRRHGALSRRRRRPLRQSRRPHGPRRPRASLRPFRRRRAGRPNSPPRSTASSGSGRFRSSPPRRPSGSSTPSGGFSARSWPALPSTPPARRRSKTASIVWRSSPSTCTCSAARRSSRSGCARSRSPNSWPRASGDGAYRAVSQGPTAGGGRMKLLSALAAVVILTAIGLAGGSSGGLQSLFGIWIPYLAVATFIVGIASQVIRWGKSAGPLPHPDDLRAAAGAALDPERLARGAAHHRRGPQADVPRGLPLPLALPQHPDEARRTATRSTVRRSGSGSAGWPSTTPSSRS